MGNWRDVAYLAAKMINWRLVLTKTPQEAKPVVNELEEKIETLWLTRDPRPQAKQDQLAQMARTPLVWVVWTALAWRPLRRGDQENLESGSRGSWECGGGRFLFFNPLAMAAKRSRYPAAALWRNSFTTAVTWRSLSTVFLPRFC